jgi:hypothetical protein
MFSECANPNCRAAFDYRQGRFYRFHKPHLDDAQLENTHRVVHFWLCGRCAESYSLDYSESTGAVIRVPFEQVFGGGCVPAAFEN